MPKESGMQQELALAMVAKWPEAAAFADRLANAGGDAARSAIAEEARAALRVEIVRTRCYAVTHSESGRADFVEAKNHAEALRKADPLMCYSSEHSEWPEYDRAIDKASLVDAHPGHKEFMRKYGSITSTDCPAWDEEAGDMMMVSDPAMDQDILVYPVLVAPEELPAESEPRPGWEGGLGREVFPEYGKWSKDVGRYLLMVFIKSPADRFQVPEGGFTYRWTIMGKGYGHGIVASGDGLPSAAAAQRAAEAALEEVNR